jgi:hypothetical protein
MLYAHNYVSPSVMSNKVAHIKRDLMCNLMAGRIAKRIKR